MTTCSSCLEESDRVVWGTGNYLICNKCRDKQVFAPCERELLSIIETQTLTYDQIVRESLYNPQTIDKVLHKLERKGQVKRIQIKNQKTKGWIICVTK